MAVFYHDILALFVTSLRISVQIRRALKEMTFLSYEFGKGQYTFYPVKLSRFAEEKFFVKNTKISYREPLQTGSNASLKNKSFKSQTFFWRVLGIQIA